MDIANEDFPEFLKAVQIAVELFERMPTKTIRMFNKDRFINGFGYVVNLESYLTNSIMRHFINLIIAKKKSVEIGL